MQVSDIKVDTFCCIWYLKHLGRGPACSKNPNNRSCIDFFLKNPIKCFHETQVFKTGLSDFHKLLVTILKFTFPKPSQK